VFVAVCVAGIASLILELSLLREFVFVIGSSAFTNSLVISVFLAGLAIGTYFGTWKRIRSGSERAARIKFALIQSALILYIALFYITKDYFIYISTSQHLIFAFFTLAAFLPSFLSGAGYATIIEILYRRGERYVVYVYAVSTLGNVAGGLLHGYVFVYVTGIQTSYAVAVLCSVIAALLVYRPGNALRVLTLCIAGALLTLTIQNNLINDRIYHFPDLLFRKYSPAGLVEVWRTDDGKAVELNINNIHQYYSYDWDNRAHAEWAYTSLEITDRPSDILVLGYGSGISTAAYLSSANTVRVDTIENCLPVIEAGKLFFPGEYRASATDPRSHILIEDFRRYIRFTDRRYDIVLLDHSILDPYYAGFFTTDFFVQLKRILKPGGVVASLGIGLSWNTTHAVFPYIYTYTDSGRPLITENGYFLSATRFPRELASVFALREPEGENGGPVYTDHTIYGNSPANAFSIVKL